MFGNDFAPIPVRDVWHLDVTRDATISYYDTGSKLNIPTGYFRINIIKTFSSAWSTQ